jgi:hydroquinone glucosyltransferase
VRQSSIIYVPWQGYAPPNVVVFTSPDVGHVVPVAQLAARLAAHHGFTAAVSLTNLSSLEHSSALATLLVANLRRQAPKSVPL